MGTSAITVVQGLNASYDLAITNDAGMPKNLDGARIVATVFDINGLPILVKTTDNTTQILVVSSKGGRVRLLFVPNDTVNLPLTGNGVSYTYKVVATYADATQDEVIEPSLFNLTLGGITQPLPPTFDNTVKVDHNYLTPDSLRYVTPGGSPIVGAQIRLYLQADYVAGRLTAPMGVTSTDSYGRWTNPILTLPGNTYVIQFLQPGMYGPDTRTIIT